MSIVELPSQTASDRCEQPDQTAAIRGARLSELETPVSQRLGWLRGITGQVMEQLHGARTKLISGCFCRLLSAQQ